MATLELRLSLTYKQIIRVFNYLMSMQLPEPVSTQLTKAERVCFRNTNRRIRRRSSDWIADIASVHSAALGFQTPHLKAKRTPTIIFLQNDFISPETLFNVQRTRATPIYVYFPFRHVTFGFEHLNK